MHRTTPGLRTNAAARLTVLERGRPEWGTWLRLLARTHSALDDPSWHDSLTVASEPTAGAPLLHQCEFEVDAGALRRLMDSLTKIASRQEGPASAALRDYQITDDLALRWLEAVVRHDRLAIEALAADAGVSSEILQPIAGLAIVPLLNSAARQLRRAVPWAHGYCPICGGWPLLAELRSLDRSRRLRCGRCGGDWRADWLWCPYCGERDHQRLSSLVPEGKLETVRVEACSGCHRYLKTVTTLQAILPFELLLQDLETVELDMVALDRGYHRPQGTGSQLDIRVTARSGAQRQGAAHDA